jgi:hypothetical protein
MMHGQTPEQPTERKHNMKKFKIYINGKYLESFSKLSEAEARIRSYERQDRYERDVEGYTNPLPTYEIRK